MSVLGYVAAVVMGLSLGLIGGGGSILTVPILVYLFGVTPLLASSYSLFLVGATALVGGVAYLKKGEVDIKTGVVFALPSLLGITLVRAYVLPWLPDPVLFGLSKDDFILFIFALLMVLASFSMLKNSPPKQESKSVSEGLRLSLIGAEGLIVGGVTGLVGAGGGFLIIPALVALAGVPMKKAVGTSLLIIAVKSLLGFATDLERGVQMDGVLLMTIFGVALLGLGIGMLLSKYVNEKALKKGFGIFVLIMGTFVLWDSLRH